MSSSSTAPDPSSGASRRRLFLGDVHGCREELERLLERVRYDPSSDRLLPVGDLVNRGPDSLGVLRLLKRLGAEPVLGNHDLHLLRRYTGSAREKALDTLEPVLRAVDSQELTTWLAGQPLVRDHGDCFQVHAGLSPRWPDPVAQLDGIDPLARSPDAAFAVSVRTCTPAGELARAGPDAPSEAAAWYRFYRPEQHDGRRVVFGHWAERGLVRTSGVLGLDTGCVWGGALSLWIAEEDRLVSEPARRAYVAVRSRDGDAGTQGTKTRS